MKINNNIAIGKSLNYTSKNEAATKPQLKQTTELPKIDAQYYRAYNSINFKGSATICRFSEDYTTVSDENSKPTEINVSIPLSKEKTLPLNIKGEHLKYVVYSTGDVDEARLEDYSQIYKKLYLSSKDNPETTIEQKEQKAQRKTENYMKLFDRIGNRGFGYIDRNEKLLKNIKKLSLTKTKKDFNLMKALTNASIEYAGSYDLDYLEKAVKVLDASKRRIYKESFPRNIYLLNSVMLKDKENEGLAANKYADFIKEYGEITYAGTNLFMHSFNPVTNKFDEKANKKVMELLKATSNTLYEDKLVESNSYNNCFRTEAVIFNDYFSSARNEQTGELKKDTPDINLFVQKEIEKYLK